MARFDSHHPLRSLGSPPSPTDSPGGVDSRALFRPSGLQDSKSTFWLAPPWPGLVLCALRQQVRSPPHVRQNPVAISSMSFSSNLPPHVCVRGPQAYPVLFHSRILFSISSLLLRLLVRTTPSLFASAEWLAERLTHTSPGTSHRAPTGRHHSYQCRISSGPPPPPPWANSAIFIWSASTHVLTRPQSTNPHSRLQGAAAHTQHTHATQTHTTEAAKRSPSWGKDGGGTLTIRRWRPIGDLQMPFLHMSIAPQVPSGREPSLSVSFCFHPSAARFFPYVFQRGVEAGADRQRVLICLSTGSFKAQFASRLIHVRQSNKCIARFHFTWMQMQIMRLVDSRLLRWRRDYSIIPATPSIPHVIISSLAHASGVSTRHTYYIHLLCYNEHTPK